MNATHITFYDQYNERISFFSFSSNSSHWFPCFRLPFISFLSLLFLSWREECSSNLFFGSLFGWMSESEDFWVFVHSFSPLLFFLLLPLLSLTNRFGIWETNACPRFSVSKWHAREIKSQTQLFLDSRQSNLHLKRSMQLPFKTTLSSPFFWLDLLIIAFLLSNRSFPKFFLPSVDRQRDSQTLTKKSYIRMQIKTQVDVIDWLGTFSSSFWETRTNMTPAKVFWGDYRLKRSLEKKRGGEEWFSIDSCGGHIEAIQ